MLSKDQLAAYLTRIGCVPAQVESQPLGPQLLRQLQNQHLMQVPFDNLDIMAGLPIAPDTPAIYDKIVLRHRGGICYETNNLFGQLLSALGFGVQLCWARIPGPGYDQDGDHLLLLVDVAGEQWLADVGFGRGSFFSPIAYRLDEPQADERGEFILRASTQVDGLVEVWCNGALSYRFSPAPRQLADFLPRWTHFATAPDSRFRTVSLVAIETANGRLSLSSNHLRRTVGDQVTVTDIANEQEFRDYLRQLFGIVL